MWPSASFPCGGKKVYVGRNWKRRKKMDEGVQFHNGGRWCCLMPYVTAFTIDLEMRGETKSGDDLRVSWNTDDLQLLFINLKRYWQDACSMEKKQSQVLALIYHGLEDHQQTSCQTCRHHAKRVLYLVQTRDQRCGQLTPCPSCVMVESQSVQ